MLEPSDLYECVSSKSRGQVTKALSKITRGEGHCNIPTTTAHLPFTIAQNAQHVERLELQCQGTPPSYSTSSFIHSQQRALRGYPARVCTSSTLDLSSCASGAAQTVAPGLCSNCSAVASGTANRLVQLDNNRAREWATNARRGSRLKTGGAALGFVPSVRKWGIGHSKK